VTRLAVGLLRVLAILAIVLLTGWAALAAYWSDIPNRTARTVLSVGIVLATILVFARIRRRGLRLLVLVTIFGSFFLWWASIEPSNDRNWQPDVSVLPFAEVNGDMVTVHNIRNFAYQTETNYTSHYYDKSFELNKLNSLDLIAVYWMGDAIAHVIMSFGFADKDYLCFSIETRKEKNEEYSSLMGFFKQYELIYVVADERDVIRLRTDYRHPPEDVYIFRTQVTPENTRKLFMEYIKKINSLHIKPEFYNTLTTNCTTNIVSHFRAFGGHARYSWKVLLSGYAPLYAYQLGGLDNRLPFEDLKREGYVNPKARAIGDRPDFSVMLRKGVPGTERGETN